METPEWNLLKVNNERFDVSIILFEQMNASWTTTKKLHARLL